MSDSQRRALDELWEDYVLELSSGYVDLARIFGNTRPVTVEIGFGMGDSLLETARSFPERNFVGIEVHRPGIGHLLREARDQKVDNLRIAAGDSREILPKMAPPGTLDRVQVFFPDPWPKKRHHKRRLINAAFLDLMAERLMTGGILHVATDWQPYADEIRQLLESDARFRTMQDIPRRPMTKYEKRGIRLGHEVADIAVRRLDG